MGGVIPGAHEYDWLIILGGPMGTYDEERFPWLVEEKRAIERALSRRTPVLGICLGAQLLADTLGAKVYPQEHKEIGWHPIELTQAGRQSPWFGGVDHTIPFHWHSDTFDIPSGTTHLASSVACENQAFSHGDRVLGLQFHIESTPESIELLLQNSPGDLSPGGFVQNPAGIRRGVGGSPENLSHMMEQVLAHFLEILRPRQGP